MTTIDITMQPRVWADQLAKRLPRATELVRTQRIITTALVEHRNWRTTMALAEKMKRLAERSTGVPRSLETMVDEHLAKFDAFEARGKDAFGKLATVMCDVETGISAAEDAMNQLTNNPPV